MKKKRTGEGKHDGRRIVYATPPKWKSPLASAKRLYDAAKPAAD
jgi:hypothetical protein